MNDASSIVFRDFLQQCTEEKQRALLAHISPMQQEELLETSSPFEPLTKGIVPPYERLDNIHPSWIEPRIRTHPKEQIALFLSALLPEQATVLARELDITSSLPQLKKITKTYLRRHLFSQLTLRAKKLLPIECLPSSNCNDLLTLPFSQFLTLFNYWGLHDLSYELQFVIDKGLLVDLHKALDEKPWLYLQNLMTQAERFHFNRLYIEQWNRDPKVIHNLIHQRGINRLAKALRGQHPSLIWHISHILDIGRGTLLTKYLPQEDPENISEELTSQLHELLRFLG